MANIDRPITDCYWVIPRRFLAGEYPGTYHSEHTRQRLDAFLEFEIDTFIDLTGTGELLPYAPILNEQAGYYGRTVTHVRFPILDFSIPDPAHMTRILDYIDAALAAGRNIYVHCWGGVGRTGTTVGCYLVRHGLTGQQALAQLAAWWQDVPKSLIHPTTPETDAQRAFILNWKPGQ